jgi:alanyl-tRNA synthetase
LALFRDTRAELARIAALLKSRPGALEGRVAALQGEVKSLTRELRDATAKALSVQGRNLTDRVETVGGVPVLAARSGAASIRALRGVMDDVRSKMPAGVICLTAEEEGKVSLVISVSRDLADRYAASVLITDVAAKIGGSGGGRPEMAQAGGTNAAGIDDAFATLKALLR